MNILVCPLTALRRLLGDLAARPRSTAFARVGPRTVPPDRCWLVRDGALGPGRSPAPARATSFGFTASDRPPDMAWDLADGLVGRLVLGRGPARGRLWGAVRTPQGIEPLDRLDLVGPGMFRLPTEDAQARAGDRDPRAAVEPPADRWSRTVGALGGEAVWRRLAGLHIAVVGCGRSGSVAAAALARLGVRRLTLVDPDAVEEHNLGEMDVVTGADLGRPKAEALAAGLSPGRGPGLPPVAAVVASVAHPAGLAAARGCDVLFCCVDGDAARLACGLVAALHHRVLVDLGTGVHFAEDAGAEAGPGPVPRLMGADVRLIVPGDGCLLCRGGLAGYAAALDELTDVPRPWAAPRADWRGHRAGSLAALNQMAVALGVRMLQDLVAGRLGGSAWARLEFDGRGRLAVDYPGTGGTPPGARPCALCARAGRGDDAPRPVSP